MGFLPPYGDKLGYQNFTLQKVADQVNPKPVAGPPKPNPTYQPPPPSTSVTKNFFLSLPGAVAKVGKDIVHGITRSGGSVGLTLGEMFGGPSQMNVDPNDKSFTGNFQRFFFGNDPLKSLDQRIVDAVPKVQQKAAQLGINMNRGGATLLAAPFILGSTALDFTGFGGEEKSAIKALSIASEEGDTLKILKNLGLDHDLASTYAPLFARVKNEKTISDMLTHVSDLQGLTKPIVNRASDIVGAAKKEVAEVGPKLSPETMLQNALQAAKKLEPLQENLYRAARSEKFAQVANVATKGEAGFLEGLTKLKGSLPKLQFDAIRSRLPQEAIDGLFDQIKASPHLTTPESVAAGQSLMELFDKGKVPTPYDRDLLSKVFSEQTIEAMTGKTRPPWEKWGDVGLKLWNVPKTLISSFLDFSFSGRQGVFAAPTYRKEYFDSFAKQFKWFTDEEAFNAVQEGISKNKWFDLMRGRVSFTGIGDKLSQKEESYFGGEWAKKIPGVGKLVEKTERTYTAFANKFRSDMFSSWADNLTKMGMDLRDGDPETQKLVDAMANSINEWTGRGKLPFGRVGEKAGELLNGALFSPRWGMSRARILTNVVNPFYYMKTPATVIKQDLKVALNFSAFAGGVLGLAKLAGADINLNPANADFGKVKIGNSRIDITAGFGSFIRLGYMAATGKYQSSTGSGVTTRLGEKLPGYEAPTKMDKIGQFFIGKESPGVGVLSLLFSGNTDAGGNPIKYPQAVIDKITPILLDNLYQLWKDDPKSIPLIIPDIFGFGVQTYKPQVKINGKVLPWNQNTETLQYNKDTADEVNRYKLRIKQALKAGDKKKADEEVKNMQDFIKSRKNPPR